MNSGSPFAVLVRSATAIQLTISAQGGPFGENIVAGQADVASSIQRWTEPGLTVSFDNTTIIDLDPDILEFTQLVWKNTTQLGCGRTNCSGQNFVPGWFVVCAFSPKGNIPGEFEANVQPNVTNNGKSGVIGDNNDDGITSTAVKYDHYATLWSLSVCIGITLVATVLL